MGNAPKKPADKPTAEKNAKDAKEQQQQQQQQKQQEEIDRIKAADKDYYSILALSQDATENDVKKSFKKLAVIVHPDQCHLDGAKEAFQKLKEACDCLTDKDERAKYDAEYEQHKQKNRGGSAPDKKGSAPDKKGSAPDKKGSAPDKKESAPDKKGSALVDSDKIFIWLWNKWQRGASTLPAGIRHPALWVGEILCGLISVVAKYALEQMKWVIGLTVVGAVAWIFYVVFSWAAPRGLWLLAGYFLPARVTARFPFWVQIVAMLVAMLVVEQMGFVFDFWRGAMFFGVLMATSIMVGGRGFLLVQRLRRFSRSPSKTPWS